MLTILFAAESSTVLVPTISIEVTLELAIRDVVASRAVFVVTVWRSGPLAMTTMLREPGVHSRLTDEVAEEP